MPYAEDFTQLTEEQELRFQSLFGDSGSEEELRPLDAAEEARFQSLFGDFAPGEPAFQLSAADEIRFANLFGTQGAASSPAFPKRVSILGDELQGKLEELLKKNLALASPESKFAQVRTTSSGWATPQRNGMPRAMTYAESSSSTIEALADMTGLDAAEALGLNGWLRDESGNAVFEFKSKDLRPFSLPNTAIVCAGNDISDEDADSAFRKSADEFATGLKADGINAIFLKTWGGTRDKFMGLVDDINTFGWVFFGHGENSSPMLAHELGVLLNLNDKLIAQKAHLEKTSASKKDIFKIKKTQSLLSDKFENMRETAEIKSDELNRPFKFSYLLLFGCNVNSTGTWDNIHSKNAVFFLPKERVYAKAGIGMENASYINFKPKGL